MSEAFVYMFVVASGASSGVAVVGFVSYRLFVFMQGRVKVPNKKKRGIV